MDNYGLTTYLVCGVNISTANLEETYKIINKVLIDGTGATLHLCNAYTLSLASRNLEYKSILNKGTLNLADGAPVAWLGRSFGIRKPVRGASLFNYLMESLNPEISRHFFLGGRDGVAKSMAEYAQEKFPKVNVAGYHSPPFVEMSKVNIEEYAELIRSTKANIVWIGLGTPKQDIVTEGVLNSLTNVVVIPIGAAFDFLTGNISQAPKFLHGTGFEWLYRLYQDPKRLWRRYLVHNMNFILHVFFEKLKTCALKNFKPMNSKTE